VQINLVFILILVHNNIIISFDVVLNAS